MKNLLLLATMVACLQTSLFAQKRYVDIKLNLDSPRNNQVVAPGTSMAINTVLTNLGPDTLYSTDSMALLVMDPQGMVIAYDDGTGPKEYYHGFPAKRLAPGDTMHLKGPRLPISVTAINGPQKFCIRAVPYRDSINEMWYPAKQNLSDTGINTINNDSCVTIYVLALAVEHMNLSQGVSVYPNPAREQVNFSFRLLNNDNVNISVIDVGGREVIRKEVKPGKGEHLFTLNTAQLAHGIYLYRIETATSILHGKLTIE